MSQKRVKETNIEHGPRTMVCGSITWDGPSAAASFWFGLAVSFSLKFFNSHTWFTHSHHFCYSSFDVAIDLSFRYSAFVQDTTFLEAINVIVCTEHYKTFVQVDGCNGTKYSVLQGQHRIRWQLYCNSIFFAIHTSFLIKICRNCWR